MRITVLQVRSPPAASAASNNVQIADPGDGVAFGSDRVLNVAEIDVGDVVVAHV
jgi:hypothetical protein